MSSEKQTKEYFKKWQNVKLSDSSRERMKENLLAHAQFHSVTEGVRADEESRLYKGVHTRTSFFTRLNIKSMPVIAIAVVLVLSGGTSLAAQGSLPGDFLYPVKIEVNENIKSAFAVGAESEARLQARLLEERIEEAKELKSEGRLNGALALEVRGNIESQAKEADEASDESEASVAVETRSSVRLALARFNSLISDGSLAINSDTSASVTNEESFAMEADENSDMNMSYGTSMMTTKEVVVEELRPQTKIRIDGLAKVIEKHKAEFKAAVYAEFTAQIDDADKLLARSETEAEAQAKNSVIAAAEIAGQIESTLSLLGQVKIDEETGAIIDIDLSKKPVPIQIDPIPFPDPAFGGGVDGDAGGEIDISDDMIEGTFDSNIESTSGLSI